MATYTNTVGGGFQDKGEEAYALKNTYSNTRTTAVFTIQYLRSIGFDINNNLFAHHSWYFRNALVRANYKNAKRGIMYDFGFLERFFRNQLMDENNELKKGSW